MTESLDGSYQVWLSEAEGDYVIVVHGTLERASVESCLTEAAAAFGRHPRLSRAESITRIDDPEFGTGYLGWKGRWAIWGNDRARIEDLLAAIDRKGKPSRIAVVLGRIDGASPFWFGVLQDYGAVFLGARSGPK
jgi:hypothetical protein